MLHKIIFNGKKMIFKKFLQQKKSIRRPVNNNYDKRNKMLDVMQILIPLHLRYAKISLGIHDATI
jgi:hypothetical protein